MKELPHPFYVPHSEWFCQSLCENIGVSCPSKKIIERISGELVFGSRWEGGTDLSKIFGGPNIPWWHYIKLGKINIEDFISVFSKLYSFDLFVNNVDRHMNNFLVREQLGGVSILAYDFSNSWMVNGFPPPDLPMSAQSNTVLLKDQLKNTFPDFKINLPLALGTVSSLRAIGSASISSILDSHPSEWLSSGDREIILNWWQHHKNSRLDGIEGGLNDGRYL